MNLQLLYTRSAVLLARPAAGSVAIADLITSLGPWPVQEVIDHLDDEHPDLAPGAAEQVEAFLASGAALQALAFWLHADRPA